MIHPTSPDDCCQIDDRDSHGTPRRDPPRRLERRIRRRDRSTWGAIFLRIPRLGRSCVRACGGAIAKRNRVQLVGA